MTWQNSAQSGEAGTGLPARPQQGWEEQFASSKRASNSERRVQQLVQGIHLGSHVSNINQHHLFVLLLVVLK